MVCSVPVSVQCRWYSAAICAAGLVSLGLLFFVNPAAAGWLPPCPLHAWTGLDCPGCGSLRALHSLLHLQGMQAIAYNPLLCLCLPFIGLWSLWHVYRVLTGQAFPVPFIRPALLWMLVVIICLFGVARNVLPTISYPVRAGPGSILNAAEPPPKSMNTAS